jgi:hypothetical protein
VKEWVDFTTIDSTPPQFTHIDEEFKKENKEILRPPTPSTPKTREHSITGKN